MFSSSRQKTLGVSSLNPTWGKNSSPQRSPALQFVFFLQSCSKTFLNISHISDCLPGIAGLTPTRSFGMEPEERCLGDGDGRLCPLPGRVGAPLRGCRSSHRAREWCKNLPNSYREHRPRQGHKINSPSAPTGSSSSSSSKIK